eukprot:TRINITY_DN2608_c0_g1_i2.p1 TRINITY_DN2608_c0_g1~~TRINITY_DN2608_c0_g1_i2.p1  ORF type:complete len:679 (-),score=168.87 TRINITY_DN2608_c0_g1_i2:72-2108(-)
MQSGVMTPMQAGLMTPPPMPVAPNPKLQHQHQYMTVILQGMETHNMAVVAQALGAAARAGVQVPDHFLQTVKTWMEGQARAGQSPLGFTSPLSQTGTPTPLPKPGMHAMYPALQQQLEDAIARGDDTAKKQVLMQAAQLTHGGFSAMQTPPAMVGTGMMTPMVGGSPGAMTPAAFGQMTPVATPAYGFAAGAQTPMVYGAVTPQVTAAVPQSTGNGVLAGATPKAPSWLMPDDERQQQQQQQQYSRTNDDTTDPSDAGDAADAHRSTAARLLKTIGTAKNLPPVKKSRGYREKTETQETAKMTPERVPTAPTAGDHPLTLPTEDLPTAPEPETAGPPDLDDDAAFDDAGMPDSLEEPSVSQSPSPVRPQASVATLADYLRSALSGSMSAKKLGLHFRDSEGVRAIVEENPDVFVSDGGKVSLKDQQSSASTLQEIARELARKLYRTKLIKPDHELTLSLHKLAELAMQVYPDELCRLLTTLSKGVLRRPAIVGRDRYSAQMPLVLACLFDRIVMLERQQGGVKRFETALGSIAHKTIFRRWIVGVTPGSQFLANMLLHWERNGYFKAKQLEEPHRTMALLVAYAKADGVSDPEKAKGAAWYRLVQRPDSSEENCHTIAVAAEEVDKDEDDVLLPVEEEKKEAPARELGQRQRTLKAAAQMGIGPSQGDEPAAKRHKAA